MNLESRRTNYEAPPLLEHEVFADPIAQLHRWLEEAMADAAVDEANAMTLATAGGEGSVSARIVLLRGLDQRGLQFYTSYFSRKGEQLLANPRAAATFFWPALHRQVRVEGVVTQLSEDESDAYFATRPRGHQLSAWASEQSAVIEDRATLAERIEHFAARFAEGEVPRPHSWGGYLLAPEYVEFWQGQPNRLHDRLAFRRGTGGWMLTRLQP